jgi:surfeit locus 1 family protein
VTPAQRRRLRIPALSTLAMLAVLLFLGTWQVQRLLWKQALLAAIAAAERAPATPLGPDPAPLARVRAEGSFLPATALYSAEPRPGTTDGARLLAVLTRPGAPPVLVDRGWVPIPTPPLPPPPAAVEGYIRPPEPAGAFTPAPDLAAKRFYALDPAAIGPTLGIPNLAPYILVAMGDPGLPDPARTLPRPTNNHLAYAITWYGLAIALLAIFALHTRKVLRP